MSHFLPFAGSHHARLTFALTASLCGLATWGSIALADPPVDLLIRTDRHRDAIAGVGDLNADGHADFATSDTGAGSNNSQRGEVYIFFGGPDADDVVDLTLSGPTLFDEMGVSLAGPGDVNGDGFDDLLVGAPFSGSNENGKVLVYFGGPAMNSGADLLIFGSEDSLRLGSSVSGAGDHNGDGYRDFLCGGEGSVTANNSVLLFLGGPGLDDVADLDFGSSADGFGTALAGPGDLNGDGFDDIVLGEPVSGSPDGVVYVVFGRSSPEVVTDLAIVGPDQDIDFGAAVSGAGDLNGDGFLDIVIGTDPSSSQSGRAYVCFGGPAMDAAMDLTLFGQVGDQFGVSVSGAGDLNGDGHDDLLVGSPSAGSSYEGKIFIYYGGSGLDAISDASVGGSTFFGSTGSAVVGIGDFDADGLADFAALGSGQADVYSLTPFELLQPNGGERWAAGRPARVSWEGAGLADIDISLDGGLTFTRLVEGAVSPGSIEVIAPGTTTETALVRVRESGLSFSSQMLQDQSERVFAIGSVHTPPLASHRLEQVLADGTGIDQFGFAVDGIDDFNGDGFPDYVIGAWRDEDTGRAHVYFGGPDQDDGVDLVLTGEATSDFFGFAAAGAGDLNGDGYGDVVVSAPLSTGSAGRSYVYFGGPTANSGANLVFEGEEPGAQLGLAAAGVGDANGDGFDDLLLGAYKHGDLDEGRVYLHFGGPTVDTSPDLFFNGTESLGQLGNRVAGGDINGDGIADLLMTALADGPGGAGSVHLRLGKRVLASPDPEPDLQIHAEAVDDDFGLGLGFVGDVNGDGFGDFLVGAPDANNFYGRAYLFYGSPDPDGDPDLIFDGTRNFGDFGAAVAGAGDVNGDGFDDLLIGAPGDDPGRAFLYFGGPGMDTQPDAVFQGEDEHDATGSAVCIVGDTRGDGFDDVLIGSPRSVFSSDPGQVDLFDWNRYHVLDPTAANDWSVGQTETVKWLGAQPADIWLSADGGDSYTRLRTGVGGSANNSLVVDVPNLPSQSARVRLTPSDPAVRGSVGSEGLFSIVPPHPDPWWHVAVDSDGYVGNYASLALGASGRPYIAYYDEGNEHLRLARREGAGWQTELVDSIASVGLYSSLAIDAEGGLHVSYMDLQYLQLKYARNLGTGWEIEQPVPSTDLGSATSLVLDAYGRPHIAFDSSTHNQVWYTTKVDGVWNVEAVGVSAYGGSLALDADGLPAMAYAAASGADIRFTQKDRSDIWWEEVVDIGDDTIRGASVVLDADNQPHLCWLDTQWDEVRYATRTNGTWKVDVVATLGVVNLYTSLSLDSQGRPHVTYADFGASATRGIYHAVKRGQHWRTRRVDGDGDRLYPSAQLDDQDNVRIAYWDKTNQDLRYASNAIELRGPAAGLVWPVGAPRRIEWNGTGTVDVSLSVNGGETWERLAEEINGPAYTLTVPHVPTRYAQIRLERDYPASEARTDSLFTIESSISLEMFRSSEDDGGATVLEWSTTPGLEDLAGYVLERTNPAGGWELLADGIRETSFRDPSSARGARYLLSGRNGLGEELVLGELGTSIAQGLTAWPLPYRGGELRVSFQTASGLGGAPAETEVGIYDPNGRLVRRLVEGEFEAGLQTTNWDGLDARGSRVPSGVYFLRAISGGQGEERKLVVLR